MGKIKVYHFNNGSGGGTFSVIKNLLQFSNNPNIENHIIFTINRKLIPDFKLPELEGASSRQVFYYSPKCNFYSSTKQLAKLIPDDKAVVLAHDWLELGMMSNLGMQNPVVQIVHGNYDYYYELSKKHETAVDKYIAISPVIFNKLCKILPQHIGNIHNCRFPVPPVTAIEKSNEKLNIFYCVRSLDDENKQFSLLPLINAKLREKNVLVEWTIIGDGIAKENVESLMGQYEGIAVFSKLPNEEVLRLLPLHDIFILPSLKEGFPVAVVEAMKAGVVPLVSNWEGATEQLIINNETGYYVKTGDFDQYAELISGLHADRTQLYDIAVAAIAKANELFDPFTNTKNIEELIVESTYIKKRKQPIKVYGSRLDQNWIPNGFVKFIRQFNGK